MRNKFNYIITILVIIYSLITIYQVKKNISTQIKSIPQLTPTPTATIAPTSTPYLPAFDVPLDIDLQHYIYNQCKENHIDFALFVALIQTESDFDPKLIHYNHDGSIDYGLCQINKHSWVSQLEDQGINNLLNPYQNVRFSICLLAWIKKTHPNLEEMLIVYNRGENGWRKLHDSGIKNTEYSKTVLNNKIKLEERQD
jgi:soluble lytic murein transglycosylase-like protein